MKTLIVSILLFSGAMSGNVQGDAPFCLYNQYSNYTCRFYNYKQCIDQAASMFNTACVPNPEKR